MSVIVLLQAYAKRIRDLRRASAEVSEPALAPVFHELLQGMLSVLPNATGLIVVPEYRHPGVGRPDIALARQGGPPRAFIELKSPAKPVDPRRWRGRDKSQYERLQELRCWGSCNFAEFMLFRRNQELGRATIVPDRTLKPDQSDKGADQAIADHDHESFKRLAELLAAGAGQEPIARDAQHLAALLAHSARLVRGIVRDRLAELQVEAMPDHPLLQVRAEFRDVLYAHPEAGGYTAKDFNDLFSNAFAQTLAFGLLLVREATTKPVGEDAWTHMPEEHPLMRTALRVLSLDEVARDVGVGFDVMRDTVNSFAPYILAAKANKPDPILYFYEDFLETFDPEARERYGVYYTPLDVVRYMVAALDRSLRPQLAAGGLLDRKVTLLDPAVGTGTFLLGIAEHVKAEATAEAGEGMAALAVRDLAVRMFGFELLVGPYAVAHYRLHHALRWRGEIRGGESSLPRLGIYLTDTLAQPGAAAPIGRLGFVSEGIADERREANRIKAEQPILAIIGNPPYRRLEEGENRTLVGDWLDGLWEDLKDPVRVAGQGGQLNTFPELSVAFWRWAMWKLFEADNAPKRGVVAFISNRKFLTGWPYAGLRKMMRERFDRIDIIDLRGDERRGERAGVEADQGVFDIRVGTAITVAVANGSESKTGAARVFYQDTWTAGLFSRRAKLEWLRGCADRGATPHAVPIERGLLDDMRPGPFLNGDLVSLRECFIFCRSGLQTKRDHFVYDASSLRLAQRVNQFLRSADEDSERMFHGTAARRYSRAKRVPFDNNSITAVAYRPLDSRFLYNHPMYGDRLRPELQAVWGDSNISLYAMPGGTGKGPAVWCHGFLPDYHAFRGSYGGYAFPLHDRRPHVAAPNVSSVLVQGLSMVYGEPVDPEGVFASILCLLSAASYTLRFAEDLEDVFPHVPFPARQAVFQEAVRIGREIRAVETFSRKPNATYLEPPFARLVSEPQGFVVAGRYGEGEITLGTEQTGRIAGIPHAVWDFKVSGYQVVWRWLKGREGLPADLGFVREFRDICARVAELLDLFQKADIVLDDTLNETLTREALSLAPKGQDG